MAQRSQASLDFCHNLHAGSLLQGLQELRSDNLLMDVVLCVSGKEIPCHRNVLAACSGYFRAMFCNGHRESKENKVTIQDVSTDTLQLLVDYAYTSKVTITEENAVNLLEGANFFQIYPVHDACATFISGHLSAENCLKMVHTGSMLSCPDLEEKARLFALREFAAVSETAEFLYWTKDQLIALLSSDDLNAPEETVYKAVMAWINHNTRKRKKEMRALMELVRFPFMDRLYFMENVETNGVIRKSCKDVVMETRRYQLFPGEVQSPRTRPRRSSGLREAVVVIGGIEREGDGDIPRVISNSITSTCSTEPSIWSWETMTKMKRHEGNDFAVAVLGTSDIIVANGSHPSDVWLYQTKLDSWSKLPPIPSGQHGHKLAVLQGKVYAIGGRFNCQPPKRDVQVYDQSFNKWSEGVPLPGPRCEHAVAVVDGNIYVIGGFDEKRVARSTVFCFSPGDSQWRNERSMPKPGGNLTATVLDGSIYVVGIGEDMLCFSEGSWNVVARGVLSGCGMTAYRGGIYVYGGNDRGIGSEDVWRLDPDRKTLFSVGDMPKGLYDHACVTILKRV